MNRRKLFGMLAAVPLLPAVSWATEPRERGLGVPYKHRLGDHPTDLIAFLMIDARSKVQPGQKVEIRLSVKGDKIGWYWNKHIQSEPIVPTRWIDRNSFYPDWYEQQGRYLVNRFRA